MQVNWTDFDVGWGHEKSLRCSLEKWKSRDKRYRPGRIDNKSEFKQKSSVNVVWGFSDVWVRIDDSCVFGWRSIWVLLYATVKRRA